MLVQPENQQIEMWESSNLISSLDHTAFVGDFNARAAARYLFSAPPTSACRGVKSDRSIAADKRIPVPNERITFYQHALIVFLSPTIWDKFKSRVFCVYCLIWRENHSRQERDWWKWIHILSHLCARALHANRGIIIVAGAPGNEFAFKWLQARTYIIVNLHAVMSANFQLDARLQNQPPLCVYLSKIIW